jgi:hypothetical protein
MGQRKTHRITTRSKRSRRPRRASMRRHTGGTEFEATTTKPNTNAYYIGTVENVWNYAKPYGGFLAVGGRITTLLRWDGYYDVWRNDY